MNDNVNKENKTKESQDQILYHVATHNRRLFYDGNNVTYIEIQDTKNFQPINNYLIPIESSDFTKWLTKEFFHSYKRIPNKQLLDGIKQVVSEEARISGEVIKLHNRVALVNDTIYHDLGTNTRQMVKIDVNGWDVGHFQVYFKRHTDMKALPSPLNGCTINDLLQFFPPLPQPDRCLALCWLIASFFSNIERAFLLLEGDTGMGKTALSKILKSFIDPDVDGAISYNDNVHEVAQILDHHYIPYFDNVTAISRKVSDLLCTSYSSGSYAKRKIYTDDGDHVFQLSGNAIFTTITLLKPKGDFLDRCYKIAMKEANNAYRSKQQFTEYFDTMAPALYGAVLDTVSATMRKVKEMPTVGRYRTVDFDRYASAAAEVMGFGAEFFWKARGVSESIKLCSISDNTPLIEALTNFLKSHNYLYSGYMKKLVQELPQYTRKPDLLPKQPNVLARRLGEIDTELRLAGIVVEKKYNDNSGALYEITFSEQQPSVIDTPEITISDQQPSVIDTPAEIEMEAAINSPPVEPDDLEQLITQVIEKHASDMHQSELEIDTDDNDDQNPFLNFYKK